MSLKDGPGEGGWAVFAEKVVAERDENMRAFTEAQAGMQRQLDRVEAERDALRAALADERNRVVEAARAYDTSWAVATELGIAARSVLREWDEPLGAPQGSYSARMRLPMDALRDALTVNLDDVRALVRNRHRAEVFARVKKYADGLEEDGLIHEPAAIRNMIEEMEKD